MSGVQSLPRIQIERITAEECERRNRLSGDAVLISAERVSERLVKMARESGGVVALLTHGVASEDLEKRWGIPVVSGFEQLEELLPAKAKPTLTDPSRGVIGVAHFKGGVGASSSALSLASCWARNGIEVVVVDLDDISPQITVWGDVSPAERDAVGRCVRRGQCREEDLETCLHYVYGFDRKLLVMGQPQSYAERFHFKADVLEGAPDISEFISQLLPCLSARFEIVLIDLSRSWGLSAFSALAYCSHVLLVAQAESHGVQGTLDLLGGLKNESEDISEKGAPWSLLLTTLHDTPANLSNLESVVEQHEARPFFKNFFLLPFATRANIWGRKGATLFDLADERYRVEIRSVAGALVKRSTGVEATVSSKLLRKLQSMKAR